MPLIMYFGSKISENMTLTPEGYLICHNVPIGRTGYMDYLGEEIGIESMRGQIIKVYRSPEELFSKATIASFEGKPTTNNHPTENINISTIGMLGRGHVENVRQEGEFLVADLYITDNGLVSEIQNNIKREVSCGYDCEWIPISDNKYEQKGIVGNHVAVVQNGRAGSRVAIKDSKPNKSSEGDKKMAKNKMTKSFLAALGFKHFAQDADPADIAEAMDAMNEEKEEKPAKGAESEKKEIKDEAPDNQAEENAEFKKLADKIKELEDQIAELKKGEKGESKDSAEVVMDAVEKELSGKEEVKDEDPEKKEDQKEEVKEEAKDEFPEGAAEKSKVADSVLRKIVQDMKPIIMAIPDEKSRNEAAKKFATSVHDARTTGSDGYANILNTVAKNKKSAMDSTLYQKLTMTQAAEKSCNAWQAAGEKMKSNK